MTSSHKYSEQIALHNKAIDVLNMKIKAMQQLDEKETALANYEKLSHGEQYWSLFDKAFAQKRIDFLHRAIPRINKYYASIAAKVCSTMATVEVYDSKVQGLPLPKDFVDLNNVSVVDGKGNVMQFNVANFNAEVNELAAMNTEYVIPGASGDCAENRRRQHPLIIHSANDFQVNQSGNDFEIQPTS